MSPTFPSVGCVKDHDPLLPNTMVGVATTPSGEPPLLDLFFDDSDMMRNCYGELGVWDFAV